MTSPNLTPYWDRWRRKRRTKYLRAGATPAQAESGSSLEAEARQRIEKNAGRRVALAAGFGLIPGHDGSETLGFWIDPDLIDPEADWGGAEMMPSAEIPTYLVRPESEPPCDTVIFVAPCPICGRRHIHGFDADLRNGVPSDRVAHCPDPKFRPRRFRENGSHERGYLIHLNPEK